MAARYSCKILIRRKTKKPIRATLVRDAPTHDAIVCAGIADQAAGKDPQALQEVSHENAYRYHVVVPRPVADGRG